MDQLVEIKLWVEKIYYMRCRSYVCNVHLQVLLRLFTQTHTHTRTLD